MSVAVIGFRAPSHVVVHAMPEDISTGRRAFLAAGVALLTSLPAQYAQGKQGPSCAWTLVPDTKPYLRHGKMLGQQLLPVPLSHSILGSQQHDSTIP
jgi:hypothetical protein